MNVDNQVLLHIKAGHIAPAELLQLILAKKPNAFGFTVQAVDGGKPDLSIIRKDAEDVDLPMLEGLMEKAKDFPLTMYFGALGKDYHEDDIQPFIIHDGDGNPFITLTMEGVINGFDEPSDHTEHYNYATEILIPKIIELCDLTDGDLEKIMSRIDGELFNKDFLSHVGHRAVLSIMPLEGDVVTRGRNELGEPYDWGMVSNRLGYGDVNQEPKKEAAAPKKAGGGFWGGKTKAVEPPKDVATKGDGPRTSVPEVKEKEEKPDGTIAIAARPPSWCHSNDDVRAFYSAVFGSVPNNWKKRIPVTITQNKHILAINNLKDFQKEITKLNQTETAAAAPKSGSEVAKARAAESASTALNPKLLEQMLDDVAKIVDAQSKEIMSPLEMQKQEAKIVTFSESFGIKPIETLNIPVKGLEELDKKYPGLMLKLAIEMRALLRATYKPEELEAMNRIINAPPAEKEAAPAAKKGGFWGGKKNVA